MNEINWQEAFNALLTMVVAGLGVWFKAEFSRIHKRIDEMRTSNEQAHKDMRVDHTTCQQCLPERFVPRAEFALAINNMTANLADVRAVVHRIEERLAHRP
jgi:hypothetical protein